MRAAASHPTYRPIAPYALAIGHSALTALAAFVLANDLVENYLIAPRVYGDRMRLGKVAVLLAFAFGASLGGVVGGVLALPAAAIYPTIERIWLRGSLGDDVVGEHQRLRRGA